MLRPMVGSLIFLTARKELILYLRHGFPLRIIKVIYLLWQTKLMYKGRIMPELKCGDFATTLVKRLI